MGFYAKNFVYGGEVSESYNLQIASSDVGTISSNGSGTVEIIQDFIFRKPVPYFYGVKYSSSLSFPVTFFSPDEITALDASYIQKWLFGSLKYKDLAIAQPDMEGIYFRSIFTNPQIIKSGNLIRGFSGTCICDSQWVRTYPRTLTYNYTSAPSGSSIVFYNNSHYEGYNKPNISFTMNASGGDISIVNASDSDREFEFTSLSPYEVITVNSDLGIIESNLGYRRLSNFNKNFMRLKDGVNNLELTGDITQLNITYQFIRRLGG